MSVIIQGTQLRDISLGRYAQGQESDVTTEGPGTFGLFAVTGGEVLITALWGKVSTAITTTAETFAVQTNPTTGDTSTIVTGTDLGGTDTTAGTVLGFLDQGDGTIDFKRGGQPLAPLVVTTGQVELVVATALSDGVADWYCTWVPLTAGATVVASTQAFAA